MQYVFSREADIFFFFGVLSKIHLLKLHRFIKKQNNDGRQNWA